MVVSLLHSNFKSCLMTSWKCTSAFQRTKEKFQNSHFLRFTFIFILAKVIKASGNEVEAYWPSLFAKALKGTNVEDLLNNVGSASSAAAPVAAAAPVEVAAAKPKGKFSKLDNKSIRGGKEEGGRGRRRYGRTLRRRLLSKLFQRPRYKRFH